MGKVIFWLVLVFAVLFVLRLVNVAKARKPRAQPGDETRAVMVRCVECGVFLPQADAQSGPNGPRCGDAQCKQRADRTR